MDGLLSPGFSWWIENKFHSPSGLRFHRIIYFQVSRAVCFSHNRSFLPFPHTCQLLSASAVICVLLPNCMTKLWKCVRVQQLRKACSSHGQCGVTTPEIQMGTRKPHRCTALPHNLSSKWQCLYQWAYLCGFLWIFNAAYLKGKKWKHLEVKNLAKLICGSKNRCK